MTNRIQAAHAEGAQCTTPPVASGRYSWVVVLLLWTVCFFSYADRQAFFSVFPLLQKEMTLTTLQLGLLGSSFAVVYGLAGPLAGFVVDRIRRKTAILGGLELWSVICVLSALSRNFLQLLMFRGLEGIGESIYYPAALSMVSDYHGKRTRSRAMGILQTSVYAGTVGGGYWAGALAQRYGWRTALFLFGAAGRLLGLSLIRLLREPMRGSADAQCTGVQFEDQPVHLGAPRLLRAIGSILTARSLLALMAVFACANFVAIGTARLDADESYFRFHLSLRDGGFDAAVYPQLASISGSVCGGYLADRFAQRDRRGRILVQCAGVTWPTNTPEDRSRTPPKPGFERKLQQNPERDTAVIHERLFTRFRFTGEFSDREGSSRQARIRL